MRQLYEEAKAFLKLQQERFGGVVKKAGIQLD